MRAKLWGFVVIAALCGQSRSLAANDVPVGRTEKLLSVFKEVKVPTQGAILSEDERKANRSTFQTLDGYFDYNRIADAVIAPHRNALNAEQLQRYSTSFRELIRLVAFPRSGEFVRQAQVKVGKPKPQGSKVLVDVVGAVPQDDSETSITFQWENAGPDWRITDVSFNGVSVVKDYQNQFARVIGRDGVDGFLKKLAAKLEERRKTYG